MTAPPPDPDDEVRRGMWWAVLICLALWGGFLWWVFNATHS